MAVSKVILNGQTLIDVTEDTVASNNLLQGNQATGADGQKVSGAYVAPTFSTQSKTATPSETSQSILPDAGYDALSQVTVNAISSTYIGSGVTKKAAQTYTPGTTDQTIAAGQYLDGVQTIKGDANLVPSNIASGVSIFGVQGTHEGGGSPDQKQITFFDYDGTICNTYSASEFAELQTLPPNPSHPGLIAQGWNWTLAQIQDYLNVYPNGDVNVGHMYLTESNATEIDVELANDLLEPWLIFGVNGSAVIDWGDGSSSVTITGTSEMTMTGTQHVYAQCGNYTISIAGVNNAPIRFEYNNLTSSLLCSENYSDTAYAQKYLYAIKRIRLGATAVLGSNALACCRNLESCTIPQSVSYYGNGAFYSCNQLKSIVIRDGCTYLGTNMFSNCYEIEYIDLPQSVRSFDTTFSNCHKLRSITLPRLITTTPVNLFSNCYDLKTVTIPAAMTEISASAFNQCRSLISIEIPSSVTTIRSSAFSGCSKITNLTFPSAVNSIGTSGVASCANLRSVTILGPVTTLASSVFNSCVLLESIVLPADLTAIGTSVFSGDCSLKSITIPSAVTSIGTSAFSTCTRMESYHFQSETPPTITSTNVFNKIPSNCIIYVPRGCLNAYQTASNWSTYASQMQEEPT